MANYLFKGLCHVGIMTDNAEESVKWYCEKLGFRPWYAGKMGPMPLTFVEGYGLVIEFIAAGKMAPGGPIAHIALEVINIEDAVADYGGALLFVSHDRWFIERFANRIWELSDGELTDFRGSFSQFREFKARQQSIQSAEKKKQEKPFIICSGERNMRTRDYEKQQRIKEAMVRLILREGINGASVAKIAREAGVSPATIYIYYDSKEALLSAAFREYSYQSYQYVDRRIRPGMGAAELIEAIVRGCYAYTVEHEEVFSFVEQCAHCPTLAEYVSQQECCCGIFDLIHQYQARGLLRRYSDANLAAVLFAPVRFLAANHKGGPVEPQLRELVAMLQRLLLP